MKYTLAVIGMVIGQLIGSLLADSRAIDWMIGLILGVAGYLFPGFIKYTQSLPKQLLSFHGPDARISRAASSGELRAFLSQLHKGGLLLDFNPQKSDAKVDGSQWANLTEPEKIALFQILARAKAVDGSASEEIKLLSRDGVLLATYSTTNRTIHREES